MADLYKDLLKDTSKSFEDGNYFLVTITDLNPNTNYPLEFRWTYKDDSVNNNWSAVKLIKTPDESTKDSPNLQTGDVVAGQGLISITWDGKDYLGNTITNFDRVEVYIQDAVTNPSTVFGDGTKPVTFFKEAGTLTVAAPAGTYTVFLRTVSLTGKKSSPSASFTVTVESGIVIEDPTLPTGLSVATTAFGLTVSWDGSYQNSNTFTGFKSIDLYASTTDLGPSTTSGLTSSKIVGNLTINDTVNKINVGLEALKQATGTNATSVYLTGVYLYYIAKNDNNVVYKVNGSATYTRINSSSITPSQANLIDLENGIISIENLVAGNGKFTTWLRAGTPQGARIELNGGVAFTDNNYSVFPGLSVYSSGGTPIFRASLDGEVSFGGYAPSDIANIESTANGKNKIFRQSTIPSAISIGDIWINTYSGTLVSGGSSYKGDNTIFVASATGSSNWVLSKDQDITNVVNKTVNYNSEGNIVGPIQIPVNTGSIYSSKSSYTSTTSGWFLGYNGSTPVIHIGNSSKWFKWTGTDIEVRGAFSTTGDVGTNLGNTLTIAGGSISADKVIELESSFISLVATEGYVGVTGDFLTDTLQVTGLAQFDSTANFYGIAKSAQPVPLLGGGGTAQPAFRNIYVSPNLIGLTSDTGMTGDIWIQYA